MLDERCVEPLTIGVVFEPEWSLPISENQLSLQFVEREGQHRLLGEIRLRGTGKPMPRGGLRLFGVRGSSNYCLSRPQLWLHYLHPRVYALAIPTTIRKFRSRLVEAHTMIVFFICPRPVVLSECARWRGRECFSQ